VPDCPLETVDGYPRVEVKLAGLLASVDVADVFGWTGWLLEAKGWAYRVWSGAEPSVKLVSGLPDEPGGRGSWRG